MNLFAVYILIPYLFKTYQIKRQVFFPYNSNFCRHCMCSLVLPDKPVGVVGYSGVVFAMIGALWSKHPNVFKKISVISLASTGYWLATNTAIYHEGHLSGYFIGIIFGYIFHIRDKEAIKD